MLSLDGGGIRGVFTLAVLEKIEAVLRRRQAKRKSDFVLADYFDFIGGTSTGAIIAAMLSKGMSVREIREGYEMLGPVIFQRKPFWNSWRSLYKSGDFAQFLQMIFADKTGKPLTLGSCQLRTYLMLVMCNGTTGSPWLVTNIPAAKYNSAQDSDTVSNLTLPLWQLVRASAAAPAYFPTEMIEFPSPSGADQTFEFADGGITPYNNPAVAMYLTATLPQYGLNFETGSDRLFLCSVGTGTAPYHFKPGELGNINLIGGALRSLKSLLKSVGEEQDKLCRILGDCRHGHALNSELGDLKNSGLGQFAYCRFEHQFTSREIEECRREGSRRPFALDDLRSVDTLVRIGTRYGESAVRDELFP